MRRAAKWIVPIALLVLAAASGGCPKGPAEAGGLDWVSLDEALQKGDRPILIHFTTTWCGWCRKLESEVYTVQAVRDLSKDFYCVQIDGDRRKDLVAKYGVRGYPTIIFADNKGASRHRIPGYVPADEFLRNMERGLQATGG